MQRTKCKPRLHGALNSDRDTCASLGSLSLSSFLSVVASFVHSLYSTVNIVSRSHFMLVCGIAQTAVPGNGRRDLRRGISKVLRQLPHFRNSSF